MPTPFLGGTKNRARALLFKELATLRTDAKLFENVDELEWRGSTAAFAGVCEQLGAPELSRKAEAALGAT